MPKTAGLLIVHGMGNTPPDFHRELTVPLRKRLQASWDRIACRPVYYQSVLKTNQDAIFARMRSQIRWQGLRELMLFGFSDAGSLEHKKELPNSPYYQAQQLILEQLDSIYQECGETAVPVAIVAQSLGGQVMSNYIWDAQQPRAYAGIWSADFHDGVLRGTPRDRFRRLQSLRLLLTTGCNIPVFVAGHSVIEPIDRSLLDPAFRWINQFDPDDVLGWPLRPLSATYAALVEDYPVNASGSSPFQWAKSWTPYSHSQYWRTKRVLDRIEAALRALLV
jgi:hypothetical protein